MTEFNEYNTLHVMAAEEKSKRDENKVHAIGILYMASVIFHSINTILSLQYCSGLFGSIA